MRIAFALLVAAALAACSPLGMRSGTGNAASGATSSAAGQQDVRYLRDIAHANLAEIATGKLAAERAQSPAVKQFGQWMVDEHSALEAQGAQLAQAKGVTPPSGPDVSQQAVMNKLAGLSGENFDQAYLLQMVRDHTDTLQLLREAASQASDPQVRALAESAMPHVQQHLSEAQRLAGNVIGRAQ